MSTVIRTSISKNNPYYLPKHRYLELKHFCLQYSDYKRQYQNIYATLIKSINPNSIYNQNKNAKDSTSETSIKLSILQTKIKRIEQSAIEADPEIYQYIILSVTEGLSYEILREIKRMPMCRVNFYNAYRRFFWLLDKSE